MGFASYKTGIVNMPSPHMCLPPLHSTRLFLIHMWPLPSLRPLVSTVRFLPTNVHALPVVMRAFPTYVHVLYVVVHALPSFVRALVGLVVAFIHPFSNSLHHRPRPFFLCLRLGDYLEDGVYKGEGSFISPLLLHPQLWVLGFHCGLLA
jgi:hypothetical protein